MQSSTPLAGRYEIRKPLGQGSFGRTFLARDTQADRDVAIKVFETLNADWKAFELFQREAAVLRSLRHHGIPEVIEAFRESWDGREGSFLVLEYIEGTSLSHIIDEHRHLE